MCSEEGGGHGDGHCDDTIHEEKGGAAKRSLEKSPKRHDTITVLSQHFHTVINYIFTLSSQCDTKDHRKFHNIPLLSRCYDITNEITSQIIIMILRNVNVL